MACYLSVNFPTLFIERREILACGVAQHEASGRCALSNRNNVGNKRRVRLREKNPMRCRLVSVCGNVSANLFIEVKVFHFPVCIGRMFRKNVFVPFHWMLLYGLFFQSYFVANRLNSTWVQLPLTKQAPPHCCRLFRNDHFVRRKKKHIYSILYHF